MEECGAPITDCQPSSIGKGLSELSRILSLAAICANDRSITSLPQLAYGSHCRSLTSYGTTSLWISLKGCQSPKVAIQF